MEEEKLLEMIRSYERRGAREDFLPEEHLGIGDRFLLNLVIKEASKKIRGILPNVGYIKYKYFIPQDLEIEIQLRKFGFRVRELVLGSRELMLGGYCKNDN